MIGIQSSTINAMDLKGHSEKLQTVNASYVERNLWIRLLR